MLRMIRKLFSRNTIVKVPLASMIDAGTPIGSRTPIIFPGRQGGYSEYRGNGQYIINFGARSQHKDNDPASNF